MANRFFNQFRFSPEKKPVDLFAEVTFDSGTASLTVLRSKGFTSVATNGTGDFTFTLDSKYNRVMDAKVRWLDGDALPLTPASFVVVRSANTVQITTCDLSGASGALVAASPADTSTMLLRVTCSDSGAL